MKKLARLSFVFLACFLPLQTAGAQEQVEIDGILIKGIVDLESGETEEMAHIREAGSGRTFNIELKNGALPPELKNLEAGQRVLIRGKKKGEQSLAFDSAQEANIGPRLAQDLSLIPHVNGAGERTMLAVMVDFQDDQAVCGSNQDMHKILFDKNEPKSLVNWVHKTSHEKFTVTGEVVRVQVNVNGSASSCNYNSWADKADAALRAKGINPDDWDHQQYVLPASSRCSFGGVAYLGANRSWVRQCYAKTFSHELGHNFGLGHANHVKNGSYGDYTDTMGRYFFELNAPHREQMGWTPTEKIITASEDMTVRIAPLNTDPADTELSQIIKVKRPQANDYVYISYRNNSGSWDSSLASAYHGKLSVHHFNVKKDPHTYLMKNLGAGESFTITDGNISVKNLTVTEDYIEVQIQGASSGSETCVRSAPTLTLPSYPSQIEAGKSFSGKLKVKNNNNAYCPQDTFTIEIASAQGISFSMNSSEFKLSSGSEVEASFALQTASSLGEGDQELQIRAKNKEHTSFEDRDKFSFKTVLEADKTAPTIKIDSPSDGSEHYVGGQLKVKMSASDNVGVTSAKVYVNGVLKCEDTNAPYECVVTVPEGETTLMARAYDKAGNFKSETIKIIGKVNSTDTTAPTVTLNSPVTGSVYSAGAKIKAAASANDDTGVVKVEFFVNDVRKCRVYGLPYVCEFSMPEGKAQVYAIAYDKAGNSAKSNISEIKNQTVIDEIDPVVSITSPANKTKVEAGSKVTVKIDAVDNIGVNKVSVYQFNLGKNYGFHKRCDFQAPPFDCEILVSEGRSLVYVYAWDKAGNLGRTELGLEGVASTIIDNQAPEVAITSPSSKAQFAPGETVQVQMEASDNVGLKSVRLYYKTKAGYWKYVCAKKAAPYSCAFTMPDQDRVLIMAFAVDSSGNRKSAFTTLLKKGADGERPSINITSHKTGDTVKTPQKAGLTFSASDNMGVEKVQVYVRNKHYGKGYKKVCELSSAPYICKVELREGRNYIYARAYDKAGNYGQELITLKGSSSGAVDAVKPETKLLSPSNGATVKAGETFTVKMSASDNEGVVAMRLFVWHESTGYRVLCNTREVTELSCPVKALKGEMRIMPRAYDASGNFHSVLHKVYGK